MPGNFLEGVRVLDLSRILAGPLCAQMLGDMGAEVLKIERPGTGDDTRSWGPPFQQDQAAYFQSCNRNKSSLALDLKSAKDRARLDQLMARADICIDNMVPELRERMGLGSEILKQKFPRLIAVRIVAFPGSSARSNERGYDIALQAESGWMQLNGSDEGEGYKVGVAVLDVLTANMASQAALAALFHRERKGEAQHLEVSLHQTALFSLVNVATNHLVSGQATRRWGNAHANVVPYQAFPTKDRPLVIAVGNQRQFEALVDTLQLDRSWRDLDSAARINEREALITAIENKTRLAGRDELIAKLKAAQVPCAPILRADEALADNPASIIALEHASLGRVKTLKNPIVAEGMRTEHRAPPLLGEDGESTAARWLQG